MAKTVNIEIRPFEPLDIDLEGFQGKGCADIADVLAALGETVQRDQKPEYRRVGRRTQTGTRTRIGGRR